MKLIDLLYSKFACMQQSVFVGEMTSKNLAHHFSPEISPTHAGSYTESTGKRLHMSCMHVHILHKNNNWQIQFII